MLCCTRLTVTGSIYTVAAPPPPPPTASASATATRHRQYLHHRRAADAAHLAAAAASARHRRRRCPSAAAAAPPPSLPCPAVPTGPPSTPMTASPMTDTTLAPDDALRRCTLVGCRTYHHICPPLRRADDSHPPMPTDRRFAPGVDPGKATRASCSGVPLCLA